MVQASSADDEDPGRELDTAKWVWLLLRSTTEKLAQEPGDQIKNPEIDECFDWDPSYQMSERCEELGWISAELRQHLNRIEELLTQLSSAATAPRGATKRSSITRYGNRCGWNRGKRFP